MPLKVYFYPEAPQEGAGGVWFESQADLLQTGTLTPGTHSLPRMQGIHDFSP